MATTAHSANLMTPGRIGVLAAVGRYPGRSAHTLATKIGCPEAWVYGHVGAMHDAGLLVVMQRHGKEHPSYWLSAAGRGALANHADGVGRPETEAELRRIAQARP